MTRSVVISFSRTKGAVRLDDDEIDIPGAATAGVTDFGARQPHHDSQARRARVAGSLSHSLGQLAQGGAPVAGLLEQGLLGLEEPVAGVGLPAVPGVLQ